MATRSVSVGLYATQLKSLQDLLRMLTLVYVITPQVHNVREHFLQSIYYYMEVAGVRFQHIIK